MKEKISATVIAFCIFYIVQGQYRHSSSSAFPNYTGLVMAGYQGWFNAPGDGACMGWNHYETNGLFQPGFAKIDFWPDVSEYKNIYPTAFKRADSSTAYVFSCYDSQTVDLHFRWMQEYHIDGVFIQRSVRALKNPANQLHSNQVLVHALKSARKFHRAIAVMYDFEGLTSTSGDLERILNDWKFLVDSLKITSQGDSQSYLYHRGKPLVGIWGIGFPDRPNDLQVTNKMISFFKSDSSYGQCAILLGVPAFWRDFGKDTEQDPFLHQLIRASDIVRPWFVGRYNEKTYADFNARIRDDLTWCTNNGVEYAPVIFPGFSWHNMHPGSKAEPIPRNRGRFYWQQLTGAIKAGANMLYIAMFDEMDEGTSIFKTTNDPPVGASKFETFETGIPTDYYLYLTGLAADMLKKKIPLQVNIPYPPIKSISQVNKTQ